MNNVITAPLDLTPIMKQIQPAYKSDIKAFLEYSGGKPEFHEAEKYLKSLREEGTRPATFNKRLYAIKAFYKILLKADANLTAWQKAEITEKFNTLKAIKIDSTVEENQIVEDWEIRNFVRESIKQKPMVAVLAWFLSETGLRISEAVGIRTADIQKSGEDLTVQVIGKGKKARKVFVNPECLKAIQEVYGVGEFIFHKRDSDEPVSRNWFTMELKRQSKKILNREVHAHMLRHSFATLMLRRGERIELVSRYLGHSSINTTVRFYQHDSLSSESLKSKLWKFN